MKKLLADLSFQETEELTVSLGQPRYRAKQLYAWIVSGAGYGGMTNLPAGFREKLAELYEPRAAEIVRVLSSADGSEKYLYRYGDGETVEGVYLPNRYGNTLCVSTQAGCRMGCAFCASGMNGLARNLSAGEILSQFISAGKKHAADTAQSGRPISNIVLMGSGEPLDNYENVAKFIRLISAPAGINVSPRNISLSTCGLVPGIYRLADDGFGVTLSLSLHATTDEARQKIMPVAKKYALSEVLTAVKYYFAKTGRRVIFEYSLVSGVNTSEADAKRLAAITKGFPCHVNLIRLNRVEGLHLCGPAQNDASAFLKQLTDQGVSATLRRSYGSDIGGACGQLRNKFVGDNAPVSSEKKP